MTDQEIQSAINGHITTIAATARQLTEASAVLPTDSVWLYSPAAGGEVRQLRLGVDVFRAYVGHGLAPAVSQSTGCWVVCGTDTGVKAAGVSPMLRATVTGIDTSSDGGATWTLLASYQQLAPSLRLTELSEKYDLIIASEQGRVEAERQREQTAAEAARVNATLSGTEITVTSRDGTVRTADVKGEKGDRGAAFVYSDFTAEQLAALKGEKGDKGDRGEQGEAFVYSDFTEEQLAALKGATGDRGERGAKGEQGDKGDKGERGNAFTYADFTAEQLAALKGDKGEKGDKGDDADIEAAETATRAANSAAEEAGRVNATLFGTVVTITGRDGVARTVDVAASLVNATLSGTLLTITDKSGNQQTQDLRGPKGDTPTIEAMASGEITQICEISNFNL